MLYTATDHVPLLGTKGALAAASSRPTGRLFSLEAAQEIVCVVAIVSVVVDCRSLLLDQVTGRADHWQALFAWDSSLEEILLNISVILLAQILKGEIILR